jgi:hypothetical protein
MKLGIVPTLLVAMALGILGTARANTILFQWSGSYSASGETHPLAGSVMFQTVSDGAAYDLIITLANTAPEATPQSDWILDGLYFNIAQGTTSGAGGTSPGALVPISATAYELASVTQNGKNGPFSVTYGSTGANICAGSHPGSYGCSGNTVSGGWQAAYSSSGLNGGAQWAIGTAKLGIFKGNNVGGINYGITAPAGIAGAQWSADSSPYVHESASFTLRNLSSASIFVSGVGAVYGTGTVATGVLISGESPEPHTAATVIAGAVLVLLLMRRKRSHP